MSLFPKLKSGAICQYPTQFSLSWSTHVTVFLDGSEQRYAIAPHATRRWRIQLDLLDEQEALALQHFFADQAGRYGTFEFEDPLTGQVFPNCCFESDRNDLIQSGESRYRTTLTICAVQ
ncbi:MAG: DUF2460 domain-containing protein [Bryobacterales bacterium]|nr:DUF2460 domain-containing protein [Bryobacterales bacterium]